MSGLEQYVLECEGSTEFSLTESIRSIRGTLRSSVLLLFGESL